GIGMTAVENITDENCWPCQTWPVCDLGILVVDPTKATVVCINCGKDEGLVHVVCLAKLKEELAEYRLQGCDHPIISIGVDGSNGRSVWDEPCPPVPLTVGVSTLGEVMPATGKDLSEKALKQVMPATGRDLPDEALKRLLTLPAGAA